MKTEQEKVNAILDAAKNFHAARAALAHAKKTKQPKSVRDALAAEIETALKKFNEAREAAK